MVMIERGERLTLAQERAALTDEERETDFEDLAEFLAVVQDADVADPPDYASRYGAVLVSVAAAWMAGLEAGFAIDPAEPDWPVAYIDLPTGQVSWHMPKHVASWDGHDTATKLERVQAFIRDHLAEGDGS